jgi:hypothetical protein
MNIDKLIQTESPLILKQTLSLLQNYLISPGINDDDALNVVEDLLKINTNHLEKSLSLTEYRKNVSDKSLEYTEIPVDISELMIKLHHLKVNYPDNLEVPQLMKHMTIDYYSYFEETGRSNAYRLVINHVYSASVNDSIDEKILSVFPDVISKYVDLFYKEKNIKEHPLVAVYKGLEKEVSKLTKEPDSFDSLFNYWNKNNQYFNTYLSIENLSGEGFGDNGFNFVKDDVNFMHLGKIKVFGERIAEKLYIHFINHPELQANFDNNMPNYFQFFEWLNPEVFKVLNASMKEKHMDVLENYKNVDGYNFYVKSMFSISPPATSTSDLKEADFKKLERILMKDINWDKLFINANDEQLSNKANPLHNSVFEFVNKQFNAYKSPTPEMDEKFRQLIIAYRKISVDHPEKKSPEHPRMKF